MGQVNSRRRVLVVGAGAYQCDLIQTVKREGHIAIALDGSANAPGLALADVAHVCDVRDTARVCALADEAAVEAVLTAASDIALPAVAAVVEHRGLPGLRRDVMLRGRDKWATFKALQQAGLPAPQTVLAERADLRAQHAALVRSHGLPIVVKPRASAGGRGVRIVQSPGELEAAFVHAEACATGPSGVLLQAYVGGKSVGIEACFFEGELVRAFPMEDQYAPGFVSPVGHALPAALAPAELALVHHNVAAWGRALQVHTGVVNFDARLAGPTLVMLEANMRPGGSSITELLRVGLGVDISLVALRCALGEHPRSAFAPASQATPVACRLVLGTCGRRVKSHGPFAEPSAPSTTVLCERVPVGDRPPEVNGVGLLGRCIVKAQTADAAVEAASTLADALASSMDFDLTEGHA
jgi:biotin carboxylase